MDDADLSFELAGGPYAVTAARLALSEVDDKVDASTAFDMRLLVSELVTNCVQHGSAGPDDSIRLVLRLTAERVRVEVDDGGPGFELPQGPPPDDADKGWGLFLVQQLADRWGTRPDAGGCVWFELERERAGERADAAA